MVQFLNNKNILLPFKYNKGVSICFPNRKGNGLGVGIINNNIKLTKIQSSLINNSFFIVKRGMRKAAQNTILTVSQKQGISSYLYGFIDGVINKRDELLPNVKEYFKIILWEN